MLVLDDETRSISNYTSLLYKPAMVISHCHCFNSRNVFYNIKLSSYEYPIPLMGHYSGFYLIHDYCLTIKSGDGLTTFEQVGDGGIDNEDTACSINFSGEIKESFDKDRNVNALSLSVGIRKKRMTGVSLIFVPIIILVTTIASRMVENTFLSLRT